ncbi:MAG: hypothetical protein RMJ67_06360 [Elusimicrobiota bacterium]|nr:hypothetical protein [Endomicrobiia bacterium]MDW8166116.1 hypothetical protein [Elusimicrobiota bacterium]
MKEKNKNKKKNSEKVEEIVIQENDDIEAEDENIEFTQFLNEFSGSEYRIDVRKLSKDGSTWERVKTIPLDQFSADLIADAYGGGKYRFRVIDGSGKFVKQFTCVYAEPIKKENDNKKEERREDLTLQILLNQLNTNNQMLIEVIKNIRPQSENFKFSEIITLITSLKSFFPQQNINDFLEFLKTGIELGQNSSGSNDDMISKMLDIFTKIYTQRLDMIKLKNQQTTQQTIQQTTQQLAQIQPMQNNQVQSQPMQNNQTIIIPKDEIENKIFMLFSPYKDLIYKAYTSNIPTSMVSLYLYNLCDDEIIEDIVNYFQTEENVERFSKFSNISKEYIKNIVLELKNYASDSNKEQ